MTQPVIRGSNLDFFLARVEQARAEAEAATLEHVRERPVWQKVSDASQRHFQQPVPRDPQGAGAAYEEFKQHILPYPLGNIHPRFWSWYMGSSNFTGALEIF